VPPGVQKHLAMRLARSRWLLRRLVLLAELVLKIRYFPKRSIYDVMKVLPSADEVYDYFEYQFRFRTRRRYWIHSRFFKQDQRGFGEPAFHAFWEQLFAEVRPQLCLEIGVYRGQTLSLWALLHRDLRLKGHVVGLTPLSAMGDTNSEYPQIDYLSDIRYNFDLWGLEEPSIIAEPSNSSVAISKVSSVKWDLIYIDGCHELDVVRSDFLMSLNALRDGGLLVMDDSSIFQENVHRSQSFAGHPGPSLVAETLGKTKMTHLLRLGHLNLFQKKKSRN